MSASDNPVNSPAAPQVLPAHHLKALKLPTFLSQYDKIAQDCAREGVDHPRYLLRLAELELIERERRMVERRVRAELAACVIWIYAFPLRSASHKRDAVSTDRP